MRLAVHAGDRMTASVTVAARHATLRLRNLSTGRRFSLTRRVPSLDVSSAEWIVEAPSLCSGAGTCTTEALTDFDQVAFSATSATLDGHTGPIADPAWSTTALELRQSSPQGKHSSVATTGLPSSSLIVAVPSSTEGTAGAFGVRWQQQAVQSERATPPTLPGASTVGG